MLADYVRPVLLVVMSLLILQQATEAYSASTVDDQEFDSSFFAAILGTIKDGRKVKVSLDTARKLTYEQDASCPSCGSYRRDTTTAIPEYGTVPAFLFTSTTTAAISSATSIPPPGSLTLINPAGYLLDIICGAPASTWVMDLGAQSIFLTNQDIITTEVVGSPNNDYNRYIIMSTFSPCIAYAGNFPFSTATYDVKQTIKIQITDALNATRTDPVYFFVRISSQH